MSHVPSYVYALFLVLVWLGVTRCFPRTIRIERLLIMPVLMLALGLRGFFDIFPSPGAVDLLAGLCGTVAGVAIGYRHVQGWSVAVDRERRSLAVPGDVMMLVIILATFVFEFALHYAIESRAVPATAPALAPVAAVIWTLFIGMSIGRNLSLASRFWRARQDASA